MDACSPKSHVYMDAVDDSVSVATDRDKQHPITEVEVYPFFDLDVDVSKGKAVSTQRYRQEDFNIIKVISSWTTSVRFLIPFGPSTGTREKCSRNQSIAIVLTT